MHCEKDGLVLQGVAETQDSMRVLTGSTNLAMSLKCESNALTAPVGDAISYEHKEGMRDPMFPLLAVLEQINVPGNRFMASTSPPVGKEKAIKNTRTARRVIRTEETKEKEVSERRISEGDEVLVRGDKLRDEFGPMDEVCK